MARNGENGKKMAIKWRETELVAQKWRETVQMARNQRQWGH
jgi:hypothetical protein